MSFRSSTLTALALGGVALGGCAAPDAPEPVTLSTSDCGLGFDASVEHLVQTDNLEEGYALDVLTFGAHRIALLQEGVAVVGTISGQQAGRVVSCMATGYRYNAEVLALEPGVRMVVRVIAIPR